MNCIHHPDRNAAGTCAGCGGGVCEFCKTVVDGIIYCPPCVDKMLAGPSKAAKTSQGLTGAPMGKPAATDPYAAMFAKPPASSSSIPPAASQATPYKARATAGPATPSTMGTAAPYAARSGGAPALAGEVVEGRSWLGALGMLIVSACGGLALGGVFMPWVRVQEWILTFSMSGWDATRWDSLVGETIVEPYLLIAGAALILACALPATVLAFTSAESQDTVRTLARVSTFGTGWVLGVIIWTIVDLMGEPEISSYISYGVWVILAASIAGLAASAFMSRWGGGQSRFYVSG